MQFSKIWICASLLVTSHVFAADIPIESRGLSDTTAPVSAASASLNWDLVQKNEQLESQLRILRGKIEELENSVDKLNSELTNRYTDLDQRLELLKQKVDPEEPAPEAAPTNTDPNNSITPTAPSAPSAPNNPPPTTSSDVSVAPSSVANTAPSVAANAINANQTPVAPVVAAYTAPVVKNESTRPVISEAADSNMAVPTEQERAAYTVALEAYKNGGAQQAIIPMQDFLKNYPSSVYAGNAHFWLAEFYLASEPVNYNEAKKNYGIVIRHYQNSVKAPRALFQLYNLSNDVDKSKSMAAKYKSQLLKYYPNSEEAKYFAKQN